MTSTYIDVRDIPPLRHAEAMDLTTTGYERLLILLESLEEGDWARSTDCETWTIKDIVCHLRGEAEAFASMGVFVHQFRISAREARTMGTDPVDAMNALQVKERSRLSPDELVAGLRATARRSVKRRRRMPAPIRALPMKLPIVGRGSFGYLSDVIITRDVWMHQIDIALAADKEAEQTAAYDGRLVADVVSDWARRHGRPFKLVLEGRAGGMYAQGDLSHPVGAGRGTGPLAHPALF
ncbi:MAG: maleylpyruvate isomerase family mycothiol-dependent enzyme [Actinomycetota bacterium]